jgi:hypothetical protein
MKSLYDHNHRYTPEADALSNETHLALQGIFDRYIAQGYSPREISHIMQADVWELELSAVLGFGVIPPKEGK